jgi:hypothetical protein
MHDRGFASSFAKLIAMQPWTRGGRMQEAMSELSFEEAGISRSEPSQRQAKPRASCFDMFRREQQYSEVDDRTS